VDAIVVDGLEKRYGEVEALAGMTFSVREGEILGLVGPNGAGKSTTVRVLATLTKPDRGRAFVAGHDVLRHAGAVRRAIGYVPQDSGVDLEATGRENLLLQGRVQRLHGATLRRRVDELLDLFGLTAASERQVKGYSGGMKRRLDIALGLMHGPRVLYLDEPTTGLDPEARAALWEELERLATEKTLTILLTTHYLEEADRLADRLVIVSRGKVAVEGRPEALKAELRGDAVTIELEAAADGDARAAVIALDGVLEAAVEGSQLRARVTNGARAVAQIVSALDDRGIGIASVTVARPSLDEVYLHYTGRDFAEDDR
jgi:ABC-2 type transport system ATP-binding protein